MEQDRRQLTNRPTQRPRYARYYFRWRERLITFVDFRTRTLGRGFLRSGGRPGGRVVQAAPTLLLPMRPEEEGGGEILTGCR